jgi:hypothetical protein
MTSLPTTETFVDIFGWRNDERRRFLIVKWAIAHEIGTTPLEAEIVSDDLFDLGCFDNRVYTRSFDHFV